MHRLKLLERVLARFTTPDRAASILGDLLETSHTKGKLWFWVSFARVLLSLAWRAPAAWFGAYAAGGMLFVSMVNHDPLWNSVGFKDVDPSGLVTVLSFCFVGIPGIALWFIAPYAALRFGLSDRFTQLAVSLFAVTTLALLPTRLHGMLPAGAVLLVASITAGLLLPAWRRQVIDLLATVAIGSLGFAGAIYLVSGGIDRHPNWSYQLQWWAIRFRSQSASQSSWPLARSHFRSCAAMQENPMIRPQS
jgi:hypothetical protein